MVIQLSEPRYAYVASPYSLEELKSLGGYGGSYNNLYLDPSEAVHALFASLWEAPDDDFIINVYQVNLAELDGVWPRVSNTFNDINLQWLCSYRGKIPVDVLKWVSNTRADHFVPRGSNRYPWS